MATLTVDMNWLLRCSFRDKVCLTVQCTVTTGFELISIGECKETFGEDLDICSGRGRIFFNVRLVQFPLVMNLRSVDHVYIVVDCIQNVAFHSVSQCIADKKSDLVTIEELVERIQWDKYLQAWKHITGYNGLMNPTRIQYLEADNDEDWTTNNGQSIMKFRVTCFRSGKHSFASQEAARCFGGKLQDRYNWLVDLSNYNLNIILDVVERDVTVLMAVTKRSLHRRNISHFGWTTLRATICYNMLRLGKPKCGDIILDPVCGSGAIPLEGMVAYPSTFHISADTDSKAIELTRLNVNESKLSSRMIDIFHWDSTNMPLADSVIDLVVADLPFGKRVKCNMRKNVFYDKLLLELSRVVKPDDGRAVFLTTDWRSFHMALQCQSKRNDKYWIQHTRIPINMGGLKAFVYLLYRTSKLFAIKV